MRSTLLFYLLGLSCTFGQGMSSLQTDNYAGVHSVYLNPAFIADSHWKAHLNIGLGSFQASQNRLPHETIFLSEKSLKVQGDKFGITQNEIRGPGIMVQLRNNHAFAITTRYRSAQSITGNYSLVSWLHGDVAQIPSAAMSLVMNNQAFSEYAISYAAPVYEKGNHFLKVGATYKLVYGWQTSSINTSGNLTDNGGTSVDYTSASFNATHSDLKFTSDLKIADALTGKSPGKGNGFDIGVIYEFRPMAEDHQYLLNGKTRSDPQKTRYLVRAGISITDIGKIKYGQVQSYGLSANGTLARKDYTDLEKSNDVKTQLLNDLGLEGKSQDGSLNVNLPQVISIQADVSIGKSWYAGGVFTAPKNASKSNLNTSSVIAIGPRYEKNDFGFGVTGQYYGTYGKATLGANLRLGVFTLGTDNLLGFVKKNGLNPQAYAGFFIPLGRWRRENDRDGDNVSDRRDNCDELAGLWAFKGCPDTDGDGIEDKFDKCPEDAGPASTNGCPDADGDGIFDKSDACPNEAGSAKFNGCPDTDNDGIANNEDECPTLPGLPELNGCPDTDHDGIKDTQDKCPDAAGLKDLDGCALLNLSKTNQADTLVTALSKELSGSPVLSENLKTQVASWLSSHPSGKISLTISGSDQELILRIAGNYKDELNTALGEHIVASVKVVEGQSSGISVELVP